MIYNGTILPVRQSLTAELANLINAHVAPAINSALTTAMVGDTNNPATIPSFSTTGTANIVSGNLDNISEPTICIVSGTETIRIIAVGLYDEQMWTLIKLRIPFVGDSDPEDYQLISDVFSDAMKDAFTSYGSYMITPKDANGANVLPTNVAFQDSRLLSIMGPISKRNENGTLVYYETVATHVCLVTVPTERPASLL